MSTDRNTRRHKKGRVPTTDLTGADVLAASAQYTEELPVRVSAPAVVLILERDAPPRLELAGVKSRGEAAALQEWLRRDELAAEVIASYFASNRDDPVLFEREDKHAERLETARPVPPHFRVTD
jgi:hypothetical protein